MEFPDLCDLVFWKWWGIVGDFQNNGITLEPKVVTLHGNHSYTLEPLAKGCLMNICIDSSVYDYNLWERDV